MLPLRLSSPSLAILSPKAYGEKGAVDPVGTATGPFELTKVTGTTAATLDRFDDYWGGRAQASGIDARFIADGTARANALRTGEVDIAEAIPVAQAATLDKATRQETATTRTTSLLLNTRSGPFKDPKAPRRRPRGRRHLRPRQGRLRGVRRPRRGHLRPRRDLGRGQARRSRPAGRTAADPDGDQRSPSPPTTTGPNCPRSPRCCNSSWRRPGSR